MAIRTPPSTSAPLPSATSVEASRSSWTICKQKLSNDCTASRWLVGWLAPLCARGACGVCTARDPRLYLTCNFRGREDLEVLTCSGLAAVCVPRGGGEAPPKARLAALSSHRLPHAHTVSHPQAASMSDHGFARGRLACGAKRSEGGRGCAQFHSSGRERSRVACGAGRSEGRRGCAQLLSSGRAQSRLACGARRREGRAMRWATHESKRRWSRASATSSELMALVDELSNRALPRVRGCHELSVRDSLVPSRASPRSRVGP